MLLSLFLHYYVTAESYLHYNKGIFSKKKKKKEQTK